MSIPKFDVNPLARFMLIPLDLTLLVRLLVLDTLMSIPGFDVHPLWFTSVLPMHMHAKLLISAFLQPFGCQVVSKHRDAMSGSSEITSKPTKACKMPEAQRKKACKQNYKENSTGRWVRTRAFREIDYDPAFPDRLLEFDSFDKAFAWNEERRADGTGGRHAKHMSKPKDSVPTEQLAMLVEMKEEAAKAKVKTAAGPPPKRAKRTVSAAPGADTAASRASANVVEDGAHSTAAEQEQCEADRPGERVASPLRDESATDDPEECVASPVRDAPLTYDPSKPVVFFRGGVLSVEEARAQREKLQLKKIHKERAAQEQLLEKYGDRPVGGS